MDNQQLQQAGYIPSGGGGLGNASPILVLGILVFVAPFFNHVLKWNLPKWLNGVGIFLILVGAVHSIMKMR